MKTMISAIAMLVALGATGTVHAQSKGFGEGGPNQYIWAKVQMDRRQMAMEAMDKNKDGMIDKDEFMAFTEMSAGKSYTMIDMDNDGMISEREFMNTNLYPYASFYGDFR
ncbi:EF-hand domain-containing protein [Thiohalocapsa sp.]|uniref:EF-hand domain-containing protein n=1 Tax=Thiohalocapsa sp. TaxID=2497641 RepID=UPI0025DA15CD|nr:EF-hand domain-containing protein [Thiohalocapsa sp.]